MTSQMFWHLLIPFFISRFDVLRFSHSRRRFSRYINGSQIKCNTFLKFSNTFVENLRKGGKIIFDKKINLHIILFYSR